MNYRTPPPITVAPIITVEDDDGVKFITMGKIKVVVWPDGDARMLNSSHVAPLGELVTDVRRLLDAAMAVHAGTWQG